MRFLFWGFKSSRELLDKSLGSLEQDVMSLAWQRAEISVREACERLGSSVAYTTVMTTMDRLFKKGLLERRKVGRAFVYRAAATRQQLENAILSSLVDAVSDRDRALLDELERLVREKRKELGARKR
jgi:predicted transcriptional regulator